MVGTYYSSIAIAYVAHRADLPLDFHIVGTVVFAILTETRLPWRPTRSSLTSPSYLVRNRTLGPPLENNPEISPVIER